MELSTQRRAAPPLHRSLLRLDCDAVTGTVLNRPLNTNVFLFTGARKPRGQRPGARTGTRLRQGRICRWTRTLASSSQIEGWINLRTRPRLGPRSKSIAGANGQGEFRHKIFRVRLSQIFEKMIKTFLEKSNVTLIINSFASDKESMNLDENEEVLTVPSNA